jgi:hypothetical protein
MHLCRWQHYTTTGKEFILIRFSKDEWHESCKENEEKGEDMKK